MVPSIFADCFETCMGMISGGSPGPICGWLWDQPLGPTGGTITFASGAMSFNTTAPGDVPEAQKAFPSPVPNFLGVSGQFLFSEFSSAPIASTTYQFAGTNFDLTDSFVLALFGDGNVFFQVGDPTLAPFYVGTWTPNNGPHKVSFSISALGVPTLFIDDVEIPLVLGGSAFSVMALYPVNIANVLAASGFAGAVSSVWTKLFLTSGILPPTTEYECP